MQNPHDSLMIATLVIGLSSAFWSMVFTRKNGPAFGVFSPGLFVWIRESLGRPKALSCDLCLGFYISIFLFLVFIVSAVAFWVIGAISAAGGIAIATRSLSGVPFSGDPEAEKI